MEILWYLEKSFRNVQTSCPATMLITSSVKSNGYGSFLIVALSFQKSTQILNFPFFLSTTTIGDNQVASSIGLIKPCNKQFVNVLFDNGCIIKI